MFGVLHETFQEIQTPPPPISVQAFVCKKLKVIHQLHSGVQILNAGTPFGDEQCVGNVVHEAVSVFDKSHAVHM